MKTYILNISNLYNLYKTYDYLLSYVLDCFFVLSFIVLFFLSLSVFLQVTFKKAFSNWEHFLCLSFCLCIFLFYLGFFLYFFYLSFAVCYARSDLKKPEVIAELKSLPLKPRFQQLFIINASDYHNPATPSDYAFEQLRIAELSQYTDDQKKKFIAMNELEVLECFENPSFKVNADLNETKIIYNNTFYARSSK